jgi:hypothetical protein
MIIYHIVASQALPSTLSHGLKKTSRGEKGSDEAIIQTDIFLDKMRPSSIREAGISRDNNIYGYLPKGENVIDIQDGSLVEIDKLAKKGQRTLRLNVDAQRCYLSDLDIYDTLRQAIENHQSREHLNELASNYWKRVVSLVEASESTARRPEVMVTYNIPPDAIQVVG